MIKNIGKYERIRKIGKNHTHQPRIRNRVTVLSLHKCMKHVLNFNVFYERVVISVTQSVRQLLTGQSWTS